MKKKIIYAMLCSMAITSVVPSVAYASEDKNSIIIPNNEVQEDTSETTGEVTDNSAETEE